jgi:hypothetical protein
MSPVLFLCGRAGACGKRFGSCPRRRPTHLTRLCLKGIPPLPIHQSLKPIPMPRTQPGLPLGVGHIRTWTHDYTCHGTVTLFAALN